jgi:hypothetical protein
MLGLRAAIHIATGRGGEDSLLRIAAFLGH